MEYVNLKEMATMLGICRQTAKKILLKANIDIHYTRLGNKFLIKKSDIYKYLDTHKNVGIK